MPISSNNLWFWLDEFIDEIAECQHEILEECFDQVTAFDFGRDMAGLGSDCAASLAEDFLEQPLQWLERGLSYWNRQATLLAETTCNIVETETKAKPELIFDARFQDPAWTENPAFDYLRRQYLLASQQIMATVESMHDSDTRRHQRFVYFIRQWLNALAPTNFPLTNPEVLRATLDSGGKNIIQGMRHLIEDQQRSGGLFNVCMSFPGALELGRDLATTPGDVVYENELMQLIQYRPLTDQVARTPLLLIPSWVNKYYVLDLKPDNSFVRWLVEQGHTVFVISWINPDAGHRATNFASYLTRGVLEAADAIARLTGERRISALGYCLGGILLASTLAYCAAADDDRFVSATYLATSIDFSSGGDMGMFIDNGMVDGVEARMRDKGYLDGRLLAAGFSMLRENDLFWNYYVTNYLKGERPPAHDLMHWNSDNTNVPAASHSFVLRDLHLHNRLMQADAILLDGRAIDLRRIKTPTYVLAAKRDHIVHWRSTYAATQLQNGPCRFVLSGSGHIAGVINPPALGKYDYCCNENLPATADEWLAGAALTPGSWWNDWQTWQSPHTAGQIAARRADPNSIIETAPGRYVQRRLDS